MKRTRSGGQALAEFALIFPIFVILLFGIIDLGRYVYTGSALSNGVREAARSGSVGVRPSPECDGLSRQDCVIAIASSRSWGLPANGISTTVTCERVLPGNPPTISTIGVGLCRTNDLLTVRSQTTFNLVTPLIAQFMGSLNITADSKVSVNQ